MVPRRSATERPVRVLLRLPAALHRAVTRAARERALSFNEYCVRRLQAPPEQDGASAARAVLSHQARELFGEAVVGLVVIGSWIRGEAARSSDIDVLVVLSREVSITRDLYRQWDEVPLEADGRPFDVHFVHVPLPGSRPTAVWCEAAVDGRVWYDADGSLARYLNEVRRAIADGRLVRATVHGQTYWKGAA